jgi:hypothetical protein
MRGLSHRVDDNQERIALAQSKFMLELAKVHYSRNAALAPQKQNTEGFSPSVFL